MKDQNFIRLLGETYEKKLEDNDRPGSCELIVSLNLENHTYKVDQVALLSKKGKVIEKKHLKEAFIPIPKMTFIEALSRSAQADVELRHENPVLPSGISVKTLESTKKRGYNEKMRKRGFEKIAAYARSDHFPCRQDRQNIPLAMTLFTGICDNSCPFPENDFLRGIKAYMQDDEYLGVHIRSSIAVKSIFLLLIIRASLMPTIIIMQITRAISCWRCLIWGLNL